MKNTMCHQYVSAGGNRSADGKGCRAEQGGREQGGEEQTGERGGPERQKGGVGKTAGHGWAGAVQGDGWASKVHRRGSEVPKLPCCGEAARAVRNSGGLSALLRSSHGQMRSVRGRAREHARASYAVRREARATGAAQRRRRDRRALDGHWMLMPMFVFALVVGHL